MQPIADWLAKLGMSEYAERFEANRIDVSILPDLTEQGLEKLGVLLGDRRKILRAIRELPQPVSTSAQDPAPAGLTRDEAERRQLTVMFCDLVGSTALSRRRVYMHRPPASRTPTRGSKMEPNFSERQLFLTRSGTETPAS